MNVRIQSGNLESARVDQILALQRRVGFVEGQRQFDAFAMRLLKRLEDPLGVSVASRVLLSHDREGRQLAQRIARFQAPR